MSTYDKILELENSKQSPTPEKPVKDKMGARNATQKVTLKSTQQRKPSRNKSRSSSRGKSRNHQQEGSLNLPTRDEVQEFSFRLRDELKSKVQAEVPHQWPKELEEIARQLDVKKLELYRFILGEFLGKVKRKASS